MRFTRSTFFRVCVYVVLVVFLGQPLMAQQVAQPVSVEQPAADSNDYLIGKMDGERDAKGSGAWFLAGLCLGVVGVVIAFVVKPTPTTSHLVGKPQAYVQGYIEGYRNKAANQQGVWALGGWAVWIAIVVVAVASSDSQ